MPTKIPLSLYVGAVVAIILLAPYAGCHLLTKRPTLAGYDDAPNESRANSTGDKAERNEEMRDLEDLLNEQHTSQEQG